MKKGVRSSWGFKVDTGAIIGLAALIVSFIALNKADDANRIANKAIEDTRSIEKLDLEPEISLDMEFRRIKDRQPHLLISNYGPIDAIQLTIQFHFLRYDSVSENIRLYMSATGRPWTLAKLEAMESKFFTLPPELLETSRLPEPANYHVMEACITFRREPDRKFFGGRAFYFINPEGRWVSERDQTINWEPYEAIIEAAHQSRPCALIHQKIALRPGDLLHAFSLTKRDSSRVKKLEKE